MLDNTTKWITQMSDWTCFTVHVLLFYFPSELCIERLKMVVKIKAKAECID